MAVNENDRVSTRRLKEFWQTAKTWIQNFVSGAIDTSEETMSSTMDTKIRAAKPDYTKPNINGQIGDGFGYNDMVGNYKSSSGYIGFSSLDTYFAGTADVNPFKGNNLIGKQAAYLLSLYGSTNDDMIAFAKAFLKGFEGKLVAFSKAMSADANFTSYVDFINDLDNFKSTYIEAEACLLSPVWTVGENTYQTKLYKRSGNYNQFAYSLSVNGGAFEEQTPASGDGLAWCASFNNMPLDIGSCDVPDGSVTATKLAGNAVTSAKLNDNAVTTNKIYNKAVTSAKIADKAISLAKLNADVWKKFITSQSDSNNSSPYVAYENAGIMGRQLFGYKEGTDFYVSGLRISARIDVLFNELGTTYFQDDTTRYLFKLPFFVSNSQITNLIDVITHTVSGSDAASIYVYYEGRIVIRDFNNNQTYHYTARYRVDNNNIELIIDNNSDFRTHLSDFATITILFPPQFFTPYIYYA